MESSIGNYLTAGGNADLLKYYTDCKLHKDKQLDDYYGTSADIVDEVLTDFVLWQTNKIEWLKEGGIAPYGN